MPLADLVNDHLFDIDGVTVGTGGEWPALSSVEGLDSIPEYRVLDSEKPQDHGSFQLGSDYMQTRVVEMTIGMEDDYGSTTYQAKIDALKRVMRPRHINNEMILRWRYNGENARRLYCRPRRCNMPIDEISYHGIRRADLMFEAGDPRIYDDSETFVTLFPGFTAGGLSFAHGFPHSFGSSVGGGGLVSNLGNFDTPIYGRVTAHSDGIQGWSLENVNSGEVFSMDIVMGDGEFLDFNFRDKTVLLQGTATRTNKVNRPESTWFTLEPGDTSLLFSVDPIANGSATMDLFFRSAWI